MIYICKNINQTPSMKTEQNVRLANHHISVDCVVVGFDGEQLKVLLLKRTINENGQEYHDMKLPGSLIYEDEDLDAAAQRGIWHRCPRRPHRTRRGSAFKARMDTKYGRKLKFRIRNYYRTNIYILF